MTDSVLRVEHLSVRFGDVEVLRDLNFAVPRGTTLAVIGPNGAGKSVLFRALIGSLPSDGLIEWAPGVRIGYVPQKLDLERDLPITGGDFLRAKAAVVGTPRARISELLGEVGLAPAILATPIGALSGGQFQRLLMAFALIGQPSVLLLDEPAAGVDEPGQEQLTETIRRLRESHGATVLLISHDLTVVYRYATNVLCLGHGGGASFGPPATTLTPDALERLYGSEVGLHVHDVGSH